MMMEFNYHIQTCITNMSSFFLSCKKEYHTGTIFTKYKRVLFWLLLRIEKIFIVINPDLNKFICWMGKKLNNMDFYSIYDMPV
jgi:hypothetical protein